MKKNILLLVLTALIFSGCKDEEEPVSNSVTLTLGTNSVYDVYYSMSDGVVMNSDKTVWDIAFSVSLQTATILINESAGVQLYCVGDTNAWNSVDTSNLKTLKPRYNDESDWMKGAFNQNNITPFNFGWGTYNMATHNVTGDSIYVIKLTDGSLKKLFIRNRIGATDTYILRWADPDGSNEVNTSFSPSAYSETKNFIHYSMVTGHMIIVEPDKEKWDLLFTMYTTKVPMGPSTFADYKVMGVLANPAVNTLEVTGVDPTLATLSDATSEFSLQSDIIGWDWKANDPVTHEYTIVPELSYFVKQTDGSIYKMYFTGFGSMASGDLTFNRELVE